MVDEIGTEVGKRLSSLNVGLFRFLGVEEELASGRSWLRIRRQKWVLKI